MNRHRIAYFLCILLTIGLGLVSRTAVIPKLVYPYLGDILYAILIFLCIGFLCPKKSSIVVMSYTLLICYSIEALQCYDANWINTLRNTPIGKLVLGQGFLWSDIVCYTIGATIGMGIEYKVYTKHSHHRQKRV